MTDPIEHPNLVSPESTDTTPEIKGLTHKQKMVMAMAAAALALVATVGIGSNINAQSQGRQPTKNEALPNPSQVPSVSTETAETTITTNPEKNVESYNAAMEKYKKMSIDTFNKLPRDERLLYSQYLVDQTVSRGNYDAGYGEGAIRNDRIVVPTPTSVENNGQQIVDNLLYSEQIAYIQAGIFANDSTTSEGLKFLSYIYYEVGSGKIVSKNYIAAYNQMKTMSKPGILGEKYAATDTSDLASETIGSTKIDYKIVTYHDIKNTKDIYTRFIYHEYTGYDGAKSTVWLYDTSSNTLEDLKTLTTVK
jgi:hypothetical protein